MKACIFKWSVAVALLGSHAAAYATDWVGDWFESYSTTDSTSYEAQQRGYYTLGGFQGRWRMSNDFLVSVQPPKLKVGCGGIDLFGGGVSYLDTEYLVEKFERMIQAAPAFAFDLALQEFCKPCAVAMEAFESITDQLNAMQLNDCRMSKKLTALVVPGKTSSDLQAVKEEASSIISVGGSIRKNWQAFQDAARGMPTGEPPDDTKPLLQGCSENFRNIFAGGSVVANITDSLGLADYADLIRGLIGDAVVTERPTGYMVNRLDACPANDNLDAADFIAGTMEMENANGVCSPAGEQRIIDIIDARLSGIVTRFRGATALTEDDLAFIRSSPLPVYALTRDAAIAGTLDETVGRVREPLAIAYAYKVLDDVLRAGGAAVRKADVVEKNSTPNGATANRCDPAFVEEAIIHVKELVVAAEGARRDMHANYAKVLQELQTQLNISRNLLEEKKAALSAALLTTKK